jgi:hypothetical protein
MIIMGTHNQRAGFIRITNEKWFLGEIEMVCLSLTRNSVIFEKKVRFWKGNVPNLKVS